MKIAIVGAGRIGEVLIKRLCSPFKPHDQLRLDRGDIIATHPREDRRRELQHLYSILTSGSNREPFQMAAPGPEAAFLCVEPRVLPLVLDELRGAVPPETLVVSVVNGASIDDVAAGLGHSQVIRAMPNTPSRIGLGTIVWAAGPDVGKDQLRLARSLLASMGQELFVGNNAAGEENVTRATPVFASQPGIAFFVVECLVRAAEEIGFLPDLPRAEMERLLLSSLDGALTYGLYSHLPLAELRQEVTSPGGTTERMIEVLTASGFPEALAEATRAGHERSEELARAVKVR